MLTKIRVRVTHDEADRPFDRVVLLARTRLFGLLAVIHYWRGVPVVLGERVEAEAIDPVSTILTAVTHVRSATTLVRAVPFPSAAILSLDATTIRQLGWYNAAQEARWVLQRVRDYYEVLELEKSINKTFIVPPEATWLRHAASHPVINDPKIRQWLTGRIGADHIDPNNPAHMRFLDYRVPVIQEPAHAVLNAKVPIPS